MQTQAAAEYESNPFSAGNESITVLLSRMNTGDPQAFTNLVPLIYKDLHRIAEGYLRHELSGHTLQATALIHELYLRVASDQALTYRSRGHFFALAARTMRRILVDHARARNAAKRGAALKVSLDESLESAQPRDRMLVLLDDALNELAKQDEGQAQLIEMRFFGKMTAEDIANSLDIPVHVVRRELRRAQAWLRREMGA